jgi:hypothetical protein
MTDPPEHELDVAPVSGRRPSRSPSPSLSGKPARTGSGHDPERLERRLRARALGLVTLMLAGVLVAGAVVHRVPEHQTGSPPNAQLPSVSLSSHSSVEWDCPGPLPAGASPDRSAVVVANPGRGAARVLVHVAAVGTTGNAGGSPLAGWSTRLTIPPLSERQVRLETSGPAQDDAVSVLSTVGAVAVFESVAPPASEAVRAPHGRPPSAPEQSPCSTRAAVRSYIASGSTEGESDVLVSLFDPTATQAVAGIQVATETGTVAPPALQGLIVRPFSLQVFDIGKSVVQQPVVAVAVAATAGRIATGASETVGSDPTAATAITGRALVVGIGQPRDRWVLTPGLGTVESSTGVRVYDPGSRSATVTIFSPVGGRAPIEITEEVPAGQVRTVELPVPAAPAGRTQKTSGLPSKAAAPVEGPIVVQTAEDVGVVVARIATLTLGAHEEAVAFAAASSVPANVWVVPAIAFGVSVAGGIVISNTGIGSTQVEITRLGSGSGAAGATGLSTLTIGPGASTTASVGSPVAGTTFSGLLVTASAPVVVEQDLYALSTPHETVPVMPAPVEGIPVTG